MTTTQAPKQTPQDELIGRVINDRFRIISVIARGGMGRVYRAEQVPLGRLVAIKTLDPRSGNSGEENDPQFQQRFFLEASVASKLQHPNTVTVFDYGRTADGVYFIAMELVEGRSLYHVIREEAPISAERTIHVAMQIARSLREAHRLDVIHRDLKPGNVLLTRHGDEDDFVKVLDFGLVKHVESESEQELTKAGLFMGSPKYMSPEQIRGERVDARSDVYALGVVMYEMITGKVPFERENTVKVLMAHMHEAVPPIQVADCPQGLNELIMRCLSKRPEGRPSSMDEVILMLKQATGLALTTSGQFALSQELRMGSPVLTQSGRMPTGTPSQAFVTGTHGLSPNTLSGEVLTQTGMHPHPSQLPTSVSQPPQAANTWLPRIVVVSAVLIAGGFLALRFAEQPAQRDGIQSVAGGDALGTNRTGNGTSASGVGAAAGTQPPVAAQNHVVVTVTSNPPGAQVTVDGKVYGETPADIEWWGEQATPGREVSFILTKEGYEKATVVRSVVGERVNVDAQLARTPSAAPRPRQRAEPRNSQAPVVMPDNFKDDPY
jgi:eukaryotic-like serine/threonine-protein kinase